MNLQDEYNRLQLKRAKFRRAALICGAAVATGLIWLFPLGNIVGNLAFYLWFCLLIGGFVFRRIAVDARNTARVMEAQLISQGLLPNLSPLGAATSIDPAVASVAWNNSDTPAGPKAAPAAPVSPAAPATASAPEANIESRLAKARRLKN